MPKRSKRNAPASPALLSAGKELKMNKKEEKEPPQPKKTMEDLPPEVKTIILDHLTRNESRKTILGYRLVNSQWKDIISSLLEKRIISGHSETFPVIRIHQRNSRKREDLLFVRHSATMLPTDRNPFPSSSLLLYGKGGGPSPHYFPESISDVQRMDLSDFKSTFGGYLTSLTLQFVAIPGMNSLVTLLSSMASLKVLSLVNVYFEDKIIKPTLFFPTPPPLPNLTTLNVECGRYYTRPRGVNVLGRFEEKRHILCIWLIASYADQLLQLTLNTREPFPALRRGIQYFYSFPDKKTLSIANTSELAFRNLKELKIDKPTRTFIRDSVLPNLQRISVTDFIGEFQDTIDFIGKCRNTLEKLRLDISWETLLGFEYCYRFNKKLPPPIIGSPHPKLKTLELVYSLKYDRTEETMITKLLVLFPALETLHFLRFPSYYITTTEELETLNQRMGSENIAEKIVAAKTRLTALEQELHERTKNFDEQIAAIPPQAHNAEQLRDDLNRKRYGFKNATAFKRIEIYKELAALGVKTQVIVMEQLMERERIWNTCPSLKMVYVSSEGKPDGDVCVIRRPEEV